jgi:predicted P-loop ATPase
MTDYPTKKQNMKITKIKTRAGEFGAPVTTDLDSVVERMCSMENKEVADKIALQSRLMSQQGMPRYLIRETDALPYLIFSATFGKDGFDKPNRFTSLLLLDIPCPEGIHQVAEMRSRMRQIPYTLLTFAGVSGATLKVVVRCQYDKDTQLDTGDYLAFLKDAHESAARLYGALAQCDLLVRETALTNGCRMSYDPQLYYNPDAEVLPVVRSLNDPLKAYEGTKVTDDGTVVWYPDDDERERIQLEYQVCLSKAIDDSPEDMEECLQKLADYCHKARLAEEACVKRASWNARFKPLGIDLIRKTFRNAYKKAYKGKKMSQMNEKERIMRSVENFLQRRYELRYNVVKGITEFRPNDLRFKEWKPLTDRDMKSLVVEEMKEGGESWMNDIRTYLESAHVRDYNPIHEFLRGCGDWDGKHDYIEDFARRLPTKFEQWPKYFHRWFLAMVAQALNINKDYGNSMVPLLIGDQGYMKTQFCNHILPESMREYYTKSIHMDNAEQVERVLGRMWLVNIDEYDSKTPREQAKIKRLLTEKNVQTRKMRSDQYTLTPRICSFIATTNDFMPLPSGDGTRRYLCVEVTGKVNMEGRIPYRQMYAQAVAELRKPDCIYWFTADDERLIQQHNSEFQEESAPEMLLSEIFEPVTTHKKEYFWTVTAIQKELGKHLKSADVPNFNQLGAAIKKMHWKRCKNKNGRGYYLQLRK